MYLNYQVFPSDLLQYFSGHQGKYKESRECFEKVLEIKSDYEPARNNLETLNIDESKNRKISK